MWNKGVEKMLMDGVIPKSHAVWIDEYNHSIKIGISGTILTRIDRSNHYYITELRDETKSTNKHNS